MAHISLEGFTARPLIDCSDDHVWFKTSSRLDDSSFQGLPVDLFYAFFVDEFGPAWYNDYDQFGFCEAIASWDFSA
jgi:hypothetical protein